MERCLTCPFVPCRLCCCLAQKSGQVLRVRKHNEMNALCNAVLAVERQHFMYRCSAAFCGKSDAQHPSCRIYTTFLVAPVKGGRRLSEARSQGSFDVQYGSSRSMRFHTSCDIGTFTEVTTAISFGLEVLKPKMFFLLATSSFFFFFNAGKKILIQFRL